MGGEGEGEGGENNEELTGGMNCWIFRGSSPRAKTSHWLGWIALSMGPSEAKNLEKGLDGGGAAISSYKTQDLCRATYSPSAPGQISVG